MAVATVILMLIPQSQAVTKRLEGPQTHKYSLSRPFSESLKNLNLSHRIPFTRYLEALNPSICLYIQRRN